MLNRAYRQFATRICILANSRKADRVGAGLMSQLKAKSGDSLEIIGAGGELMQEQGLQPFYDTSIFHPKPFVPFRSVLIEENNWWIWTKYHPATRNYTKPMHDVLDLIKKNNIVEQIQQHKPSLVLTIDHDILSFKIHRQISDLYKVSATSKPKQVHYGRFCNRYKPYQLDYLDHVLYTNPIEKSNWNFFKFPSTYIGQSSFEKAYRFLLERNGGDHLLTSDSVFVNRDHFYSETEQYIEAERSHFRKKFEIPENATVLFLAPGNEKGEISWSLPILNETANNFVKEYAKPYSNRLDSQPNDHFSVVIPAEKRVKKQIESKVKELNWACRVLTVEEDDVRSAQAGSDLAICYNGDIVTENLVNQLSTIVIQNMKKVEFYFMLSWNRFTNEANIIADGNLFPEIIEGQCHAEKLNELLTTWYENPAHKFWPLQGFEMYIHSFLPIKSKDMGMGTHHEYFSPDYLATQTLLELAQQTPYKDYSEDNLLLHDN